MASLVAVRVLIRRPRAGWALIDFSLRIEPAVWAASTYGGTMTTNEAGRDDHTSADDDTDEIPDGSGSDGSDSQNGADTASGGGADE